jgi:dTMP kinase
VFVVIEGIDGSGKGTVTKALTAKAVEQGKRATALSFPMYDRTLYGKLVGRYLNGEFGAETHPYLHGTLYSLDRYQMKPYLLDCLVEHDLVLSDRYIPSNLCYSAMKSTAADREAVVSHFVQLEYGLFEMPVPDLIVFLDVPVDFAVRNIAKKEARNYTDKPSDIHEADAEYLSQVRSFYASELMNYHPPTRFESVPCVADGRLRTIDAIVEQIYGMLVFN